MDSTVEKIPHEQQQRKLSLKIIAQFAELRKKTAKITKIKFSSAVQEINKELKNCE